MFPWKTMAKNLQRLSNVSIVLYQVSVDIFSSIRDTADNHYISVYLMRNRRTNAIPM